MWRNYISLLCRLLRISRPSVYSVYGITQVLLFYTALRSCDMDHRVDIEKLMFGQVLPFLCGLAVNKSCSNTAQSVCAFSTCTKSRDSVWWPSLLDRITSIHMQINKLLYLKDDTVGHFNVKCTISKSKLNLTKCVGVPNLRKSEFICNTFQYCFQA